MAGYVDYRTITGAGGGVRRSGGGGWHVTSRIMMTSSTMEVRELAYGLQVKHVQTCGSYKPQQGESSHSLLIEFGYLLPY